MLRAHELPRPLTALALTASLAACAVTQVRTQDAAAAHDQLAPALRSQAQEADQPVSVELASAWTTWRPGQQQDVAVVFRIRPEWHLYWRGANDSGLPIQVEARLDAGLRAGPLRWPVPERHVSPGDLLDHVYYDSVTLLLPVSVAADAPPGPATVELELDWLVCKEVCLPGHASASLTLPVGRADQPASKSKDAARVAEARRRLPGPLPASIQPRWEGQTLVIQVPGAAGLSFFPREDGLLFANLIQDGQVRGEVLRLTRDSDFPGGDRVLGLLSVLPARGQPASVHTLDLPGPPDDS